MKQRSNRKPGYLLILLGGVLWLLSGLFCLLAFVVKNDDAASDKVRITIVPATPTEVAARSDKNITIDDVEILGQNIIKNGDFSQGLEHWILHVSNKGKITVKTVNVGDGWGDVLFMERLQSGADGTYCGVRQTLDLSLADVQQLILEADLKPEMQTLSGTGHYGGEYPAGIRLRVEDDSYPEGYKLWFVGLYIEGTNRYDNLFKAPAGEWTYVKQDLTDLFPKTATIRYIQVIGSGWDYRSYADNIGLYVKRF
jgi:hypothetical protein